jgi:hypothetical protein
MKLMFTITFPTERFNAVAKAGNLGQKMMSIIEETKPVSIYFSGQGTRGAVAVYDIKDDSQIPSICEPWFFTFNAGIDFSIAMSPEDLGKSGIEDLVKKWG